MIRMAPRGKYRYCNNRGLPRLGSTVPLPNGSFQQQMAKGQFPPNGPPPPGFMPMMPGMPPMSPQEVAAQLWSRPERYAFYASNADGQNGPPPPGFFNGPPPPGNFFNGPPSSHELPDATAKWHASSSKQHEWAISSRNPRVGAQTKLPAFGMVQRSSELVT